MTYQAALITGGSGGIGAAFAAALAAETKLLLTGRRKERLAQAAASLSHHSREIEILNADLTTAGGREAVIEAAERAAIDLFISNAGLAEAGRFCATSSAGERATIALNISATVELLHALLPRMVSRARQARRRAGVILVSSATALSPSVNLASYGAAKAFQLHLAQTLTAELAGEPIDFLALCPTYTATDFFARAGLPEPSRAMSPAEVAREGLSALGHRSVHLCGTTPMPQWLRQLLAFNPALDPRQWRRLLVRDRFSTNRDGQAWE